MKPDVLRQAHEAYQAALRGDLRPLDQALPALAAIPTAEARAYALALRAARWMAEPARADMPRLEEVEDLADGSSPAARSAAAYVCAHAERASLIAFDGVALGAWADLHARFVEDGATSPESRLHLDAARAWQRIMRGELEGFDADVRTLATAATSAQSASLVVESTILRAVAAMLGGDIETATSLARRASRMARTEALPQEEYLANLVLARMRRLTGRPHLATRILGALARVAPLPWRGWIAWEMVLAGGVAAMEAISLEPGRIAGSAIRNRSAGAALALRDLVRAAIDGDRAAFHEHGSATRAFLADWPSFMGDLEALLVAADPDAEESAAGSTIAEWCRGETSSTPPELHGVCTHTGDSGGELPVAFVVARRERRARRVLTIGVALTGPDGLQAAQVRRRPGRADAALAALALAGPGGLAKPDLFRAVYGFAFAPQLHQGVLDVLLHRARAQLSETSSLLRDGERVVLDLAGALLVPDPRCTQPLDDQVLRVLARDGGATARDAARALRIPLRTAQAALQQLVSDGACMLERRGRRVEYRVEDTTFQEPTRH